MASAQSLATQLTAPAALVTEFYRAADRRKRHTRRLLVEDQGVRYEDEEDV